MVKYLITVIKLALSLFGLFQAKNELLTSSETSAATQRADIENHLNTIRRSLEDKTKECEKANSELTSFRSIVDDLKSQISDARQQHHVEVANLRIKLEMEEKEKSRTLKENERAKEEKNRVEETHAKEIDRRKQELKDAEARLNERIISLQTELSDARNDMMKRTDEQKREESLRTRAEVELNQTKRQIQQNEETIKTVESKLNETLAALELTNNELKDMEIEKEGLSKKFEETKMEKDEEMKSIKAVHATERELLQKEIQTLNDQIEANKMALEEERAMRVTSEDALKDAELVIVKRNTELEEISVELKKTNAKKLEVEERLKSDVESRAISESKLQGDLQILKSDLEEKNQSLTSQKSKIEELEVEVKIVKQELEERTTLLTETEVDLENLKTELQEHKSQITSLQNTSSTLDEEKVAMQAQRDELTVTISGLENKLQSSSDSIQQLTNQLSTSSEEKEALQRLYDSKQIELTEKEGFFQNEFKNIQDLVQNLKAELEDEKLKHKDTEAKRREDLSNLQREIQENEITWKQEKNEFEEKLQSLEAAQSLLVGHKVEQQNQIASLQATIEREKRLALDAEEEAKQNAKAKADVITALNSQLESKNRELESAEADRVVAESRLQLEIGTLSENLNSTRSEWVASTQKVDVISRDNDELKGQIVILNTTIQNNNDERRALLERCLGAEQQTEHLNGKLIEMRKKLDDAHSAMHELGRENQALQVKHKTTISRQWADDRNAVNCKACGRAFSMTVRRHHCRHCGDIFCSECSSRSATVASSKNPVRVCERCHDELLAA